MSETLSHQSLDAIAARGIADVFFCYHNAKPG